MKGSNNMNLEKEINNLEFKLKKMGQKTLKLLKEIKPRNI
jgi:hypothetical protein